MAFNFFTNEGSILNVQSQEMAYGPLDIEMEGKEHFNLENKFEVSTNSPAYAISKSMVIVLDSLGSQEAELLNIAILPIETNYMAGFPIKFFIYRGISKESLLDNNGIVKESDNTWNRNNILDVIKENQEKINEDREDNDKLIADFNSLGLQFQSLPDDRSLESLFLDTTDEFQPVIVSRGCEIGKFLGGDTKASIQVVLDKIDHVATISLLKSRDSVLEVDELEIMQSLSEKEQLQKLFKHRYKKEKILAYMDITAFYGACRNQGIPVKGVSDNKSYFDVFFNKKTVYVDIRDERGFSYNHFLKLEDVIQIGFYNNDTNEVLYESQNYYTDWPIFILKDRKYFTAKKFFYFKIPILFGMPENANILTLFNKKVSSGKNKRSKRYIFLNESADNVNDTKIEPEPIRFKNWKFTDDSLGANHFLLKLDRISKNQDKSKISTPIWDNYFPLLMDSVFETENLQDGEFIVKTYSPINAPLLFTLEKEEVYYPTIGIAVDKHHVTFFTFYIEPAIQRFKKKDTIHHSKVIDTGKFKFKVDNDKLFYTSENQAVGFLYQFVNNDKIKDYELTQKNFNVTIDEGQEENINFLFYQKIGDSTRYDDFIENFEAITLNHQEYNSLINIAKVPISSDEDYINDHPLYITSKNNRLLHQNKFSITETTMTLGVVKSNEIKNTGRIEFSLSDYPDDIEVGGEEIILRSVIFK